ncbi:hypothetical protein E2320_003218 [Naja naja]|nr:hypothetical protein E2320_003218 [Naja naja]
MYGYMFFIRSSPHLLPVPYSVSSHMLLGKCVFSHALPSPPLVSLHQGESYEFLAKAKILDEIQNQISLGQRGVWLVASEAQVLKCLDSLLFCPHEPC